MACRKPADVVGAEKSQVRHDDIRGAGRELASENASVVVHLGTGRTSVERLDLRRAWGGADKQNACDHCAQEEKSGLGCFHGLWIGLATGMELPARGWLLLVHALTLAGNANLIHCQF